MLRPLSWRLAAVVIGAALLPGCGRQVPASVDPPPPPRLAVVVVVDQMRADYLDRFRPQLHGGLARLLEEGARFTEARHLHLPTSTAVGHATLLSGRFPGSTGIVGNKWVDRVERRVVSAVSDRRARQLDGGKGVSPRRFEGTTLADWLRAAYPRARVVSVAGKSRVAVLMAGGGTHDVYWYSRDSGRFTTSTFYASELPDWVEALNAEHGAASLAGQEWRLLRSEGEYAVSDPDESAWECDPYGMGRAFPHRLPAGENSKELFQAFELTPFVDTATVDLAAAAVDAVDLGGDEVPDLLLVGLSATDSIGHAWGPDSREMHDQVLRLDGELGELLDRLERRVGRGHLVVALASDHGVTPIPAAATTQGRPAGWVDLQPSLKQLESELEARTGRDDAVLELLGGVLYLDRDAIRSAGADLVEVTRRAADLFRAVPGVERAVTAAELAAVGSSPDEVSLALSRSFDPERSGDVYVVPKPGYLLYDPEVYEDGTVATSHGSPWDDDTHVPLILVGPGVAPGSWARPVVTVDLAPTLAALLGAPPTGPVDGEVLPEVVASRR